MDDMAGKEGPYLNPKLYYEFVLPNLKKLSEAIHGMGGKIFVHSDGNLKPILDGLVDAGIDALHSIDPSAGMDIGEVKKRYGHRLCLCGKVDCAWTLVNASPGEVAKETRNCIKRASPGGGNILCSSNVIHTAVPLENALALIETGKRYGRYPIE
jgi:uroporphyrinogen decarboxylase